MGILDTLRNIKDSTYDTTRYAASRLTRSDSTQDEEKERYKTRKEARKSENEERKKTQRYEAEDKRAAQRKKKWDKVREREEELKLREQEVANKEKAKNLRHRNLRAGPLGYFERDLKPQRNNYQGQGRRHNKQYRQSRRQRQDYGPYTPPRRTAKDELRDNEDYFKGMF